jgi:hypothetical protein
MLCVGFGAGCGTTKKADNPVVGPRPPRLTDQMLAQMDQNREPGQDQSAALRGALEGTSQDVVHVDGEADSRMSVQSALLEETAAPGGQLIREEDVAARVNGRPIFVSEVLEPYRSFFLQQGRQLSPAELDQARRQILEKDLDQYIEQAVILDAARAQFKQDQWDELQTKLDEIFYEEEIKSLQAKLKVSSPIEVESAMQESGTSLAAYKRIWGERQIAGQWVSERIPDVTVSRPELLAEYEARVDQYREAEQVRWQQCVISITDSGGENGAQTRVRKAIDDLKAGKSFDEVIETHSDAGGGTRDWTQTGSLADEKLRDTLVSLKINQIGPVLQDERSLRMVKLLGYRPEQVKPFEEVQNELRESIQQKKRSEAAQQVIEDLKAKAHVESILDGQAAL